MKLAANDDVLGRICAYLSGGSEEGSETNGQWRRVKSGANLPQRGPGRAPEGRSEDAVLAAAETHDFRDRRIQAWGSPSQQSRTMCHRCLPA
jgi:hypothetical protein